MRYSPSDEIIRLVEQSPWPARRTLERLGIPRSSFYRWYDRYRRGGPEALADRPSRPDRVWNRIPEAIRSRIVDLALDQPQTQPAGAGGAFTDEDKYFVSEASVYRLLKAHDPVTSPAYIVIKAAEEFKDKTSAPNQLWQTDFTYLKVTGWGWRYLSTVLDDFSRFIVAWKLCATMNALDVTATLDLALAASGLNQMTVVHRRGCCRTTARHMSRATWPIGCTSGTSSMSAERLSIRRPRVRSSAGVRRSRTASCSSTTTCPAISNARSPPSSSTTTTPAITRASTISLRLTSTSAALRPSSSNAKGSSARPSPIVVCNINYAPHNLNQR
jgi:putative transposase